MIARTKLRRFYFFRPEPFHLLYWSVHFQHKAFRLITLPLVYGSNRPGEQNRQQTVRTVIKRLLYKGMLIEQFLNKEMVSEQNRYSPQTAFPKIGPFHLMTMRQPFRTKNRLYQAHTTELVEKTHINVGVSVGFLCVDDVDHPLLLQLLDRLGLHQTHDAIRIALVDFVEPGGNIALQIAVDLQLGHRPQALK